MSLRPRGFDVLPFLARSRLLAGASLETRAFLARSARALQAGHEHVLFRDGDPAPGVFIVGSGHVALAVERGGAGQIVELCGPGESFGEETLSVPTAATSARVVAPALLVHLPHEAVLNAMRRDATAGRCVLAAVTRKLEQALHRMSARGTRSAQQRLIAYLLRHVPSGEPAAAQLVLGVPKGILASFLGVSRETLSRLLARLIAAGLIEPRGRTIRLPDVAKLVAVCHEGAGCSRCAGCPHAERPGLGDATRI